jgi:hypothetical protein
MNEPAEPEEEAKQRIDRELMEFLNELRVVLPGVQVLFGFLLAMPFYSNFYRLTWLEQRLYFACFVCCCAASVVLIAPSLYHRLHWRRDVRDKDEMLHVFNALALVGGTLLAATIVGTLFLITSFLFGLGFGAAAATAGVGSIGGLWYVLPLLRKRGGH